MTLAGEVGFVSLSAMKDDFHFVSKKKLKKLLKKNCMPLLFK
jgi:hypothetical protein